MHPYLESRLKKIIRDAGDDVSCDELFRQCFPPDEYCTRAEFVGVFRDVRNALAAERRQRPEPAAESGKPDGENGIEGAAVHPPESDDDDTPDSSLQPPA